MSKITQAQKDLIQINMNKPNWGSNKGLRKPLLDFTKQEAIEFIKLFVIVPREKRIQRIKEDEKYFV